MTTLIKVEGTTDIPHLILNRPDRANALNAELLAAFVDELDAAIRAGARAVVLAGAGSGFSAGADLSELTGTIDDLAVDERIATVTSAVVAAPVPIIAVLHGFCFGGAVDLAWSADLVIAAPDTRMGVPAARLGLLYNPPSMMRLYTRLGSRTLRRLALFGEEITGQDAWQAGAVDHLAAAEDVREKATTIAQNAARGLPNAVAAAKGFINALDDSALDNDTLDLEEWEKQRRALLAATDRQGAIRRHREKK